MFAERNLPMFGGMEQPIKELAWPHTNIGRGKKEMDFTNGSKPNPRV